MNHIEGSHHILIKEGSPVHLSIPVHSGKELGPGLLRKLIRAAGSTAEECLELFNR
jgi:predicted RNA binding protein YcfA (HicA-like mRNA interferase family)